MSQTTESPTKGAPPTSGRPRGSRLPESASQLWRRVVTARPGASWLVLLPISFLAMAFLLPLARMVLISLTNPSPANYVTVFTTSLYLGSIYTTLQISVIVTAICFAVGYPYAYVMHLCGRGLRIALGLFVLMPFLTSLLVRTFAWTVILNRNGLINSALAELGLVQEPIQLMNNTMGTVIGMSHILLPFLVLPTYSVMAKQDPQLLLAAEGLGASRPTAFWRVYFPLTLPGLMAGCILVFVLSLGFYITPALLGGPQERMIGQLIVTEVSPLLRFGVASVLGVVLLLLTLTVLALAGRVVRVGRILGYEER